MWIRVRTQSPKLQLRYHGHDQDADVVLYYSSTQKSLHLSYAEVTGENCAPDNE